MKPFDLKKTKNGERICTKDGRVARFLGIVKNESYPVVAAYTNEDGEEWVETYTVKGWLEESCPGESDLVMDTSNVGYINIFKGGICGGIVWPTREKAKANIGKGGEFITTVKVEWEQ